MNINDRHHVGRKYLLYIIPLYVYANKLKIKVKLILI